MKALYSFFVVLFFLLAAQGQEIDVLDNDGVVALVKAKVPTAEIITAVKTQPTNFNLDPMVVLRLFRQEGVPQEVIGEMVRRGRGPQPAINNANANNAAAITTPTQAAPAANTSLEEGVYFLKDGTFQPLPLEDAEVKMPGVLSLMGAATTFGTAVKAKMSGKIKGEKSPAQLSTPVTLVMSGGYDLIPLKNGKSRKFEGNNMFAFSGTVMNPANGGKPLNLKKIGLNAYEVTLTDLPPGGEYALAPSGMGMAISQVYTFGIAKNFE